MTCYLYRFPLYITNRDYYYITVISYKMPIYSKNRRHHVQCAEWYSSSIFLIIDTFDFAFYFNLSPTAAVIPFTSWWWLMRDDDCLATKLAARRLAYRHFKGLLLASFTYFVISYIATSHQCPLPPAEYGHGPTRRCFISFSRHFLSFITADGLHRRAGVINTLRYRHTGQAGQLASIHKAF